MPQQLIPFPTCERKPDTHKGDYGHLVVLGGSPGLTGAVCLAARAAMRTGCGLVTVGIPAGLNPIIEVKLTEPMSLPLPESPAHTFSAGAAKPALDFIIRRADAVVVGPGISRTPGAVAFVHAIVRDTPKPLIIDADALPAIAGWKPSGGRKQPTILTPHPGEMAALLGAETARVQADRTSAARAAARTYHAVAILKGHHTVVTDGTDVYVNLSGNPGMATAGMGDVLAGILGALLAQGQEAFAAARYGVYLHGLAGDLAARKLGRTSLIASDVIETLPEAISYCRISH